MIKDHRSPDILIKGLNEVKRQVRANGFEGFVFCFSGGEPTLHPGLLTILADLQTDESTFQVLEMVSNMSQGAKWWCSFIDATVGFHRINMTASWHREAGLNDIPKHRKQFSDKVFLLLMHHMHVEVNVVMVPERWDELLDDATYLYDRGLDVTLKMQEGGSPYTEEQLLLLRSGFPHRKWTRPPSERPSHILGKALPDVGQLAFVEMEDVSGNVSYLDSTARLNALGINEYEGWSCSAGFQSVMIREPEGTVYRAVACRDEPIGNIETGFQLFDGPKKCITERCSCLFDLMLPKKR